MIQNTRIRITLALFGILFGAFIIKASLPAKAAPAGHIVISEIQIAGSTANDEFVELYNPTAGPIDLSGWQLVKRTAAGTGDLILIEDIGFVMPAKSYMLLAHEDYDGETDPDLLYTTNPLSTNNTIIIRDQHGEAVDLLGMGTAALFEAEAATNPATNRSLERKALENSSVETMTGEGSDVLLGNGWDSDSNLLDFILRTQPEPQNSASAIEPPVIPDIDPTPEPTNSPEPTQPPDPEPTSTLQPDPTPIPDPEPTPVIEPDPEPTLIPEEPTLTPAPPHKNQPRVIFFHPRFTCSLEYLPHLNPWKTIWLPRLSCRLI